MSDLTDDQWLYVQPYLSDSQSDNHRGRPRSNDREVLNAILWILRTGASWGDLPDRYPPRSTCWRRYSRWRRNGVLAAVLDALRVHLYKTAGIDVSSFDVAAAFPCCQNERCWQWQTTRLFFSPRAQRALGVSTALPSLDSRVLIIGKSTSSIIPHIT